tara:strand:+ start:295 stop:600 length:306 start_codon:yes stop_codon:yes gene_type:complete
MKSLKGIFDESIFIAEDFFCVLDILGYHSTRATFYSLLIKRLDEDKEREWTMGTIKRKMVSEVEETKSEEDKQRKMNRKNHNEKCYKSERMNHVESMCRKI